jgi:hypothetical protein
MKHYVSGLVTGIVIGISVSAGYIVSHSAAAPPAPQSTSTRFAPAVLTIESQRVGESIAREAWDVSTAYFAKLTQRKPELAAAVNYVDALAATEVMADHWLTRRGVRPTAGHYRAFLCLLSWGIGCPPKPEQNRAVMLAVRDRLIDGAFFDESKRNNIRERLRDIEPSQITTERIVQLRVDQLIDLTGLR